MNPHAHAWLRRLLAGIGAVVGGLFALAALAIPVGFAYVIAHFVWKYW